MNSFLRYPVGFTVFTRLVMIVLFLISPVAVLGSEMAQVSHQMAPYDDYADVLETHVDENGRVNYQRLKANPEKLNAFTNTLQSLDPTTFDSWTEKQKIAFWINVYNASVLKIVIGSYPIEASFFKSLRYPKNSIQQISGVWDELTFSVMGHQMTLDGIEHETLRKKFNEPRIHMALVCASIGCPPLRDEPFMADKLDAQLDDQTRRFLKNPQKFRINRDRGQVYLSKIFDWFGADFVETYGTEEKFAEHSDPERAVLNFVSQHLDARDRHYLETERYDIEYLDYDWSLNEQ